MKRIRYLHAQLDIPLKPYQASAFRGAVINTMDNPSDYFHQHNSSGKNTEVIYRYPRIQYKSINGKASLICLEEGADQIHKFIQKPNNVISIKGNKWKVDVESVDFDYHNIETWNGVFYYGLINWLPLNRERHQEYKSLNNNLEKEEYLEGLLKDQISGILDDFNIELDSRLIVRLKKLYDSKLSHYKNMAYLNFKLDFYTNVHIPEYIGIGKAASTGFGIVYRKTPHDKNIDI